MKKHILVIATLLVGTIASAQSWSDEFQLGARGGLNFSSVAGDDIDSPDNRTSFYAGLVAEAPLSERFSVQPEVFYSGQGFDLDDIDFQLTGGAEYKFENGFFLQARYSYGLSEVVEDTDIHNSVFSAGLGFMF